MNNFWVVLTKPFSVLAPMEDVTDTTFRQMLCEIYRPDVFYTEFVNVDGLQSIGKESISARLKFNKIEKPIVAQIWGNNPENFYKSAKLISKLNFDGIDINIGCSQKDVIKHGCGAGLIGNFSLVAKIIQSVKLGAPKLPISVKTRIGVKQIITDSWIRFLLSLNLSAIMLHGRTARENYNTPAHWDEIGKAVELRNKLKSETLIIGNGDVANWSEIIIKHEKYGIDGVGIARGILQDPFAFVKEKPPILNKQLGLQLLMKHAKLFEKTWGSQRNFSFFKKYIKVYIQNFPEAVNFRMKLMSAISIKEFIAIIKSINIK